MLRLRKTSAIDAAALAQKPEAEEHTDIRRVIFEKTATKCQADTVKLVASYVVRP